MNSSNKNSESEFVSLWEQYQKLQHSYYDIPIQVEKLLGSDAKINCTDFIRTHFEIGEKKNALTFPFKAEYRKDHFRHIHMVSLYLLALSSLESGGPLYARLPMQLDYVSHPDKYMWFLTCLYHDTASCVEECDWNKGKQVIQHFDPCYCIYSYEKSDGEKFVTSYPKEVIKRYYEYVLDTRKNQDHGILGGVLFFDKMCRNFREKTSGCSTIVNGVYNKTDSNLMWCDSTLDAAAYISDAIISHNLWTCRATDPVADEYRRYGLYELIISSDQERISFSHPATNPLVFLLCLFDTLEPVKRFWNTDDAEEIQKFLKLISIQWGEKEVLIKWKAEAMKYAGFYDWMKSIVGMERWLAVDISLCKTKGRNDSKRKFFFIEITLPNEE